MRELRQYSYECDEAGDVKSSMIDVHSRTQLIDRLNLTPVDPRVLLVVVPPGELIQMGD